MQYQYTRLNNSNANRNSKVVAYPGVDFSKEKITRRSHTKSPRLVMGVVLFAQLLY